MLKDTYTISTDFNLPGWLDDSRRKWRAMGAWIRYEISNDGLVRVKLDRTRNPGYVLNYYWAKGSLTVRLQNDEGKERERRLYALMDRYWPSVEYPSQWKAKRPRRPYKVKEEDREKIRQSSSSNADLAWAYNVHPRTIRAIKREK